MSLTIEINVYHLLVVSLILTANNLRITNALHVQLDLSLMLKENVLYQTLFVSDLIQIQEGANNVILDFL